MGQQGASGFTFIEEFHESSFIKGPFPPCCPHSMIIRANDLIMSSLKRYFKKTIFELEMCVQALGDYFDRPVLIDYGGFPYFRHKSQNDLLASYLKCVRVISSLNAALILLEKGFTQEVYVLCRCIDEFCQDVWFLSTPLGENGPSKDQLRFIEEFFQEEFDEPNNPLKSTQKRDRVSRNKIFSAISRLDGQPINPSDSRELQRTLHQAFSGYVHGAYTHIMELYGGLPPRFHTTGMKGTPREKECEKQLVSYIYRSIIAVKFVARRTQASALDSKLSQISEDFIKQTECITKGPVEKSVNRLKRDGVKKDIQS
ncbi:hypothetical protein KJ644_05265 [Candidatus Dependentiae bacterium]|nr:hypothetical protein [Candidatus Dependentiae bacterium]